MLSFEPFFFFLVLVHLLHSKGQSRRCSLGRGKACCYTVVLYVGERSEREQWHLFCSLPVFSHSLRLPQSNWAPLVLLPEWVGLCML